MKACTVYWRRSGEISTLIERPGGEPQPAPVVPWRSTRRCSTSKCIFIGFGAAVVWWLDYSHPTLANRARFPGQGRFRIFAWRNRAGRCRWSAGFLGNIQFPPELLHTRLAPPSSAVKTSMLRAAQIPPLHSPLLIGFHLVSYAISGIRTQNLPRPRLAVHQQTAPREVGVVMISANVHVLKFSVGKVDFSRHPMSYYVIIMHDPFSTSASGREGRPDSVSRSRRDQNGVLVGKGFMVIISGSVQYGTFPIHEVLVSTVESSSFKPKLQTGKLGAWPAALGPHTLRDRLPKCSISESLAVNSRAANIPRKSSATRLVDGVDVSKVQEVSGLACSDVRSDTSLGAKAVFGINCGSNGNIPVAQNPDIALCPGFSKQIPSSLPGSFLRKLSTAECEQHTRPRLSTDARNVYYFTILPGAVVAKRLACFASHQGEPGSFPSRPTGFSQVGIVPDDAIGLRVVLGNLPFPPPLNGSQDLAVKRSPNLFSHSILPKPPGERSRRFATNPPGGGSRLKTSGSGRREFGGEGMLQLAEAVIIGRGSQREKPPVESPRGRVSSSRSHEIFRIRAGVRACGETACN
ncbi:hypothetical protein PR048_021756 [Dryococelus australis]|uniref:Uncharacterized protein n=1 Tax=Dryococelus australis TaxID=614101 RepID=A0ABQ9GZ70_9NEOP|nr:hypothetical protein PR048_021756 [Dryococelus australis]